MPIVTLSCNIKKFKLAYQLFVKTLEKLSNIEQNKSTNSSNLNEGKKMYNSCLKKKKKKKTDISRRETYNLFTKVNNYVVCWYALCVNCDNHFLRLLVVSMTVQSSIIR